MLIDEYKPTDQATLGVKQELLNSLNSLEQGAWVTLYQIDVNPLLEAAPSDDNIYYWHSGVNANSNSSVLFGGKSYNPIPMEASGFDYHGDGTLPRPRIKIANVEGTVSMMMQEFGGDLCGAKVRRVRTKVKHLDAGNFAEVPSWLDSDPDAHLPIEEWIVSRKVSENAMVVEFELGSGLDLQGMKIPRRLVTSDTCYWTYGANGCFNYTDKTPTTGFTIYNVAGSPDACSHTLAGCKHRFKETEGLPFGGFPGAGKTRI